MREEVGKETPEKEMDFYDVTRDILGFLTKFIQKLSFSIIKVGPFLCQSIHNG